MDVIMEARGIPTRGGGEEKSQKITQTAQVGSSLSKAQHRVLSDNKKKIT